MPRILLIGFLAGLIANPVAFQSYVRFKYTPPLNVAQQIT